jgi:hypothetical protein
MHPFQDKLFVFIGQPTRCTRQEARDALHKVGGVTEERITTFTQYIVAFKGAEKAKAYQKAVHHDKYGQMILLNEKLFFDVLEGRAEPPELKTPPHFEGSVVIPAKKKFAEESKRESERVGKYVLEKKRLKNMAEHGVPLEDGGRMTINFGASFMMKHLSEVLNEKKTTTSFSDNGMSEPCANCKKPSKVNIGDGTGKDIVHLCLDCHNRLMAELTGTEPPPDIPKLLSFKSRGGKVHEFEITLNIFPIGKLLTATELGKEQRVVDVHGELEDDVDEMLETLTKRIKKSLSTVYMERDGYFKKDKAVGYVGYDEEEETCNIVIDGKPYTWEELFKNVSAREGWKIKIEFCSRGDELE